MLRPLVVTVKTLKNLMMENDTMELEHYFARAETWFDFMLRHPEKRTRHLIVKLYNNFMLDAVSFHILIQNAH